MPESSSGAHNGRRRARHSCNTRARQERGAAQLHRSCQRSMRGRATLVSVRAPAPPELAGAGRWTKHALHNRACATCERPTTHTDTSAAYWLVAGQGCLHAALPEPRCVHMHAIITVAPAYDQTWIIAVFEPACRPHFNGAPSSPPTTTSRVAGWLLKI